jgi:hypothetical protein
MRPGNLRSSLKDVALVEIGNELGEYAVLRLAGLGVNVIKIEPPSGSSSRAVGPFASGALDPEQSFFSSATFEQEERDA